MNNADMKAVYIMQTSANACWALRDFSNQCEDIMLDDWPNFFWSDLLLHNIPHCKVSYKHSYCITAELTVHRTVTYEG